MYISSNIAANDLQIITSKKDGWLENGESFTALFPCIRLRSGISVLAITDRRVLALGQKMVSGWTVIQSISAAEIVDARVPLDGFKEGRVEIDTADGVIVLGAIRTKIKEELPSACIYLKALIGEGSTAPLTAKSEVFHDRLVDNKDQVQQAIGRDRPARDDDEVLQTVPQHRLVLDDEQEQRAEKLQRGLNELAALHRDGVLTDEEFARAKAVVLVGP